MADVGHELSAIRFVVVSFISERIQFYLSSTARDCIFFPILLKTSEASAENFRSRYEIKIKLKYRKFEIHRYQ